MREKSPQVAEKILEAARQLFVEQGYLATSMESVARAARVSKPTVYSHFGAKAGLFRAVVSDFTDRVLETVVPEARRVDDVRAELLAFAYRLYGQLLTPEKAAWDRMLVAAAARFPQLAEIWFEMGPARARTRLGAFLSTQAEAGTLTVEDAEFSAEMLFGMLMGSKLYHLLLSCSVPPICSRQTERLVDAFLEVHRP